jgi:hypothetical protein
MASIISVGKYDDLGEMGVHIMMILKRITRKYSDRTGTWTGLKQLKVGSSDGPLCTWSCGNALCDPKKGVKLP